MADFEDQFGGPLRSVRSAVSLLPTSVASVRGLGDAALLETERELAQARRALDAAASLIAGEVAYRSRRELGSRGLAQREGYRTAQKLVQHTTGSTARDASTLVSVGSIVHDADVDQVAHGMVDPLEPWLAAVGAAVQSASLGLDAAQAIRSGLGGQTLAVTAQQLALAVATLLAEADSMNVDQLFLRARHLRDEIDLAGVADREQELHDERSIRRVRRPNGLSRYIVDPDIESGAWWDDLYDKITAPRRGVTFVDDAERAWADGVNAELGTPHQRTTDQYVHDAITELLRIGASTGSPNSRKIVGSRQPSVRVLVTVDALTSRAGLGRIEGVDIPVSIATVERLACTSGTISLVFDKNGQALNLGREQRLFSLRQRILLAARDGGCMFPFCDRPPSWTEAHHIKHWQRDHGRTDLADGILLCRHHHMLVHNNGWEIVHDPTAEGQCFLLIPPAAIDPTQTARPMPTKSAALRDLLAPAQARHTAVIDSTAEVDQRPVVDYAAV